MKKLLFILAFIPALLSGQIPAPLVDLSEYHDGNRILEMTDLNFTNITEGVYTLPSIKVDSITADAVYYSDSYWDDLRIPLSNTRLNPAQSEPDFEDAGDGTFAWGFDADSDSVAALHFVAQLPHSYKEGTDIDAHLHWQPDGTNTGDVVWKLAYTIANINGSFSAVDTFRVIDPGDGTTLKHQLIDIGKVRSITS